jgi:Heparinase II/III-like protein/Heparinase II/III N-terminus
VRRLALAGVLAALVVPATASASSGAERLLHARCPHHYALPLGSFSHRRIAAAKRGVAYILGKRRKLDPPINWHQNPFHSYPWQKKLNELGWLDPLIYADLNGSKRALRRATRVVLDWIRQNPKADPHGFRAAWERKRAGDRLGVIAFVGRRAACRGLLSKADARRIVNSVEVHADFLLHDASAGGPVTNHGLLRDQGLLVAARYYPFLGGANEWRHVAVHRFKSAIFKLVDRRTGVHLEHTPGYQQKTVDHVRAFLRLLERRQPKLHHLLKLMKRDVAWFTMPDGYIVPIADTPFYKRSPPYARRTSKHLAGLSPFLRDGFAVARKHRSYLATVAGYHRASHKHADELSFDLFDAGRRVIVDSGRRDHTQVAGKRLPGPRTTAAFTKSSFAHSTLVVDGRSFGLNHRPYGSALDAQGRGGGWFAVLGHNPLLRSQGVRHQRLWLYRPGKALVVIDTLRARRRHTYSRFLQIGPRIHAGESHGLVRLRSKSGFRGSIWSSKGAVKLYRGHVKPLRGWYVRGGFHSLTPRFTERLTTKARDQTLISTIGLAKRPVKAQAAGHNSYVVRVPGAQQVRITVIRHGRRLDIHARPR